jgi:hypothetical protein
MHKSHPAAGSGRVRARVHAPSTPPRTNASRPVRRVRLSAEPKVERSAWLEIEGMLMDAYRRLELQFLRAAKIGARDADSLAEAGARLMQALRSHFDLKVSTVYPVLYDTLPDTGVILEAEIEIELAREMIGRLEALQPFDERYQPTINILGALIGRHFEQERARLLAAARRAQPSFARRMVEVRARFSHDAALMADAATGAGDPEATGTVGRQESRAEGRSVSRSKPAQRPRASGARRASSGSPAAGLLY